VKKNPRLCAMHKSRMRLVRLLRKLSNIRRWEHSTNNSSLRLYCCSRLIGTDHLKCRDCMYLSELLGLASGPLKYIHSENLRIEKFQQNVYNPEPFALCEVEY
jgi:hypothetical protein